jgi:hypothetical protein
VSLQVVGGAEDARALQHQIDTKLPPRQVRRVALGEHRDPSAVDQQRAPLDTDLALVTPVDGVVLDEVRQVVRVSDVVDSDEIEPVGVEQDLQRRPPDPSQPVDGDRWHVTPASPEPIGLTEEMHCTPHRHRVRHAGRWLVS